MKREWIAVGALCLALFPPMGFAAKVVVKPLSEKIIHPQMSAPANVVSYRNSALGSEVAGRVLKIAYRVGEAVKQGDLLLQIDDTSYQLSLKQSQAAERSLQARIKFSRYQLKQAKRLGSQRNVSEELILQRESELDSLMAQLIQQQVAIQRVQIDIERTMLRAPFAGVVTKRLISEGELVDPGTPLIQLLATQAVEVAAQLHSRNIPPLIASNTITLTTSIDNYPLKLRSVLPLQDSRQRTQEVRLTFLADSAIAGSAGRIEWQDLRPHLPADLLVRRDGKLGLFTAQQGKAHFIALPKAQEGRAVLVPHLSADTKLVIEGRYLLQNGDELEAK